MHSPAVVKGDFEMKTYLITGGAGFIGSNFILYLLERDPQIRILNLDKLTYAGNLENLRQVEDDPRYTFIRGDICDRALVSDVFSTYPVDCVVNFAAESHVDRSIETPEPFVHTNVLGTAVLLDCARAAWSTGGDQYRERVRYLQVSTDEVYGALGASGYFTEQTPLDPHNPYSASKASADLIVKAYYDTYRLPVNITRCCDNYGPRQFPEKLIPLMLHNACAHRELPVYGDGLQVRDWLYVADHCRALDLVLERGRPGEVYNIGGHDERTNLAVVRAIIAYVRAHVDASVDEGLIRHVADRRGHDRRYAIDPGKIHRELGWQAQTPFEAGLSRTLAWYLENWTWMEHVTGGEYRAYYDRMYRGR